MSAEVVELEGRRGLRVGRADDYVEGGTLVLIEETEFQNGTIELELAGEPASHADPNMRGFVGVAFRVEAALVRLTTPTIDPGLGGVWWNPDRSGEGFVFHFFDVGESRHLFATFYTYDGNGNQAYLVGSTTDFASPVTLDVGLTEGGVFGPSYDPDDQILLPWGTLTIDFQNCRKAVVTLDSDTPGFESYSTAIERFGQAPFDQRLCNPLH